MELIFIRHGQGEHNLDVANRLNREHPYLTKKGRQQVQWLHSFFTFNHQDIFLVSPTTRTIETVNILTAKSTESVTYISPLVGPRLFPLYPDSYTEKCDIILPIERIRKEYTNFLLMQKDNKELWDEGINTLEENKFLTLAKELMKWIKAQNLPRVFIITHDGTITNYRKLLGEQGLTREDFLGEAGILTVSL